MDRSAVRLLDNANLRMLYPKRAQNKIAATDSAVPAKKEPPGKPGGSAVPLSTGAIPILICHESYHDNNRASGRQDGELRSYQRGGDHRADHYHTSDYQAGFFAMVA